MATKKLTPAQLAEFRREHAKLYKAGLVTKPARSQKPTRHALETHRKFAGFLSGREQVVTVPRGKSKDYADKFATRGNKVLVPKTRPGERARFNKKAGGIVSTRTEGGIKVQRQYREFSIEELQKLEGRNVTFSVIVPRGTGNEIIRTKTIDELANIFARGSWRNFNNWSKYVNVEKSARARARIDQDEE